MTDHFEFAGAAMQDTSQSSSPSYVASLPPKSSELLPHTFPTAAETDLGLGELALEKFLRSSSFDTTSSPALSATPNPPATPQDTGINGRVVAAKKGTRFSRATLSVLKGWVEEHRDNPYPDEDEKEWLKRKTGLSSEQICNWFTNTRRRERIRTIKRAPSPSIRPSRPIAIVDNRGWESLNPMERWRNSPPEQDPAPLAAIEDAARDLTPLTPNNYFDNSWNLKRTPSTSSIGDGSEGSSASAFSTTFSQDSHGSFGSFMSHQSNQSKQSQRRRRRLPTSRNKSIHQYSDKSRIFSCTFCTDKFKTKHDWARHEKTLHLSLEKWVCLPSGNPITSLPSGQTQCAFCDKLDPSVEHMDSHKHQDCYKKGLASRSFYRKDHLDQHLRLMHGCKITKSMTSWKLEVTNIKSRCGFCAMEFATWQQRKDHLAKEFRTGQTMKDWKGCRGFDPDTAALVSNALPPYLIDQEAKAPLAFSASNKQSLLTHQQWSEGCVAPDAIPGILNWSYSGTSSPQEKPAVTSDGEIAVDSPNDIPAPTASPAWEWPNSSSLWEYISFHLSLYTQQKQAEGVPVTADMLRREARKLKYGDPDDVWDLSPADDPYWLHLFMQAHGLVPQEREFTLADLIQELGLMTTLGFTRKDPSLYPLDGISHEVLQALDRSGTIPSGCIEQVPQSGIEVGDVSAQLDLSGATGPLVSAAECAALLSEDTFLNAANVKNPELTEPSNLNWDDLDFLSFPNDSIGEMPFTF